MGTRETQESCTNQYSPEPWNHTSAMYHLYASHQPDTKSIENFKKIADAADRLGVKIALENTEGEEYRSGN